MTDSKVTFYGDTAGDQFEAAMCEAKGLAFGWNVKGGTVWMASTGAGRVELSPQQAREIAVKLTELADKAEER